ncbi:MAG: hypothetical protein RMI91_01405 [Gemmatales bacterium]|nr:hypothetical protein [Gemmatales bacterium]MDW7993288.1 hypothetical protein [Gemmatales bacterium]
MRLVAVSLAIVPTVLLSPMAWSQPGTGGKGDYYPLVVGTRWDYRIVFDGEVKGSISEVVAEQETINNVRLLRLEAHVKGTVVATEHLRATPQGVYRHRVQGAESKSPVLVLRYPVKAGDSWKIATQVGQQRIEGKVTTRLDEVEVPAGKFKAIVTEGDFEVDGKPLKVTTWFAEGVGVVKEITELIPGIATTIELEKFRLGKP